MDSLRTCPNAGATLKLFNEEKLVNIKLTKEDLELINRALMHQRWYVESGTVEGAKHPDFQHSALLLDRLAVPCENGAELEIKC